MRATEAAKIVADLDADVHRRLACIAAALGRPLRVLHMGNIANNAYVNAKIMREHGIEADVVVLDYYHVMGCPEWEEGVIEKLEGTQNDPDWGKTQTGNFTRPEWFLQGPVALIGPLLTARAHRNAVSTATLRRLVDANIKFRGAQGGWRRAAFRAAWASNRQLQNAKRQMQNAKRMGHNTAQRVWFVAGRVVKKAVRATLGQKGVATVRRLVGQSKAKLVPTPALSSLVAATAELVVGAPVAAQVDGAHVVAPLASDIASFKVTADRLKAAFEYYDVVQGYAVDGIYPLLGGKAHAYTCYEHGTLRDIPYQRDMLGRICAHAYQNAPAVFITNTDCVASADKLNIPRSRQFPIPHGFDSARADRFRAKFGQQYRPHNKPVTFIAPARHHWKDAAYVSWLKGNDVPVRAARLLMDEGLDFKIIFVRWGQEIRQTERLIAELGVGQHFEWIEPVAKARLWQYYLSCNGVLDQFVIPAIGGVSFETLALGRPLFTRIDEPVFDQFFGEKPPLLNVHTPEELAQAMAKAIRNPACYDQLADAALEWGARYHSSQRILQVQLDGYARFIPSAAQLGTEVSQPRSARAVA